MGRYILRYTGTGPRPPGDLERIRTAAKLTVIDDSPRMLLVEAPEEQVRKVAASLPGWICSPERTIRLPDPRPRPRRGPGGRGERG